MKVLFLTATLTVSVLLVLVPNILYNKTAYIDDIKTEIKKPLTQYQVKQVNCLAKNIYFESSNQSDLGKLAVGLVTLNRVYSDKFPNTVCQVVKQAKFHQWSNSDIPIKNQCQFSWYCDGRSDNIRDSVTYAKICNIATQLYLNYHTTYDITNGSLWYHADYVSPYWKKAVDRTVKIGQHIFYKDKDNGRKNKVSSNRGAETSTLVLLADGRY